jgi:hypothetical protein
LAAAVAVAAAVIVAPATLGLAAGNAPRQATRIVDFDGRGGFDQVKLSPLWPGDQSQFGPSAAHAFTGHRSGFAELASNAESTTKYARGIFNVHWGLGTEVWISAAFFLPHGFINDIQGHVTLMRWDNWDAYSHGATSGGFDRTGVMIFGSDDRMRLIYMDDEFRQLTPNFAISEGRWHWIEVFQRFDVVAPYSELWMDGKLLARSSVPNYDYTHAFELDRVRYGLVETWDDVQTKALHLWVDHAAVSATRLRPPRH